MKLTKFRITDMEAAKKETWFHPHKGRVVCIADIAETMTDAEAEIFHRGGCTVIEKLPETAVAVPKVK